MVFVVSWDSLVLRLYNAHNPQSFLESLMCEGGRGDGASYLVCRF